MASLQAISYLCFPRAWVGKAAVCIVPIAAFPVIDPHPAMRLKWFTGQKTIGLTQLVSTSSSKAVIFRISHVFFASVWNWGVARALQHSANDKALKPHKISTKLKVCLRRWETSVNTLIQPGARAEIKVLLRNSGYFHEKYQAIWAKCVSFQALLQSMAWCM